MAENRGGIVALFLGIACIVAGLALAISCILPMVNHFDPLGVVRSPGGVEIEIVNPGPHTLWHDHKTTFDGSSISNPPTLPSGFDFALARKEDGRRLPLRTLKTSSSVPLNNREAVALGTFEPEQAGTYSLEIANPANDLRIFSLTEGTLLQGMAEVFMRVIIGVILGVGGLVLLVLGIVFMVRAARVTPPSSHSTRSTA